MIKNWQLLFCLILLSISCGQKSNPTSTENKVETNVKVETPTSNIDFNGKKFVSTAGNSARPEEGGADFLEIINNDEANLKSGDIVESMKISITNNNILLTGSQSGRELTFTILDATTLQDAFGIKWSVVK